MLIVISTTMSDLRGLPDYTGIMQVLHHSCDTVRLLEYSVEHGNIEFMVRPCKLNNLFLIPVRANFLPPSGYILCFVIEYLILVNNPRRVIIVVIVF